MRPANESRRLLIKTVLFSALPHVSRVSPTHGLNTQIRHERGAHRVYTHLIHINDTYITRKKYMNIIQRTSQTNNIREIDTNAHVCNLTDTNIANILGFFPTNGLCMPAVVREWIKFEICNQRNHNTTPRRGCWKCYTKHDKKCFAFWDISSPRGFVRLSPISSVRQFILQGVCLFFFTNTLTLVF